MRESLLRRVYLFLIPITAVGASVLAYYSYVTASTFERLSAGSIEQSTFVLLHDKIDRIERTIIDADEAAFAMIDASTPDSLSSVWLPVAETATPSVRSVALADANGRLLHIASRTNETERTVLRKIITEQLVPSILGTEQKVDGTLRHVHRSFRGSTMLFSYRAVGPDDDRRIVIAQHDLGFLLHAVFAPLFEAESGRSVYNVVDDENVRLLGPSLTRASDYTLAQRFPTTLYAWRVQLAPKNAPLLAAQGRTKRWNQIALIGVSFVAVILGLLFLMYGARKERQLNEAKTDFVANVSHELKTPLSVIRMFSEMLLSGRATTPEKREEYLQIIVRESERMAALVENVLDFAAVERGKQTYDLRSNDLVDIVKTTVEAFRHRLEGGKPPLHLEIIGSVPNLVLDEQALVVALVNLLDNAVKYGEQSPITVTVERNEREAIVRVRDRGPGIPPADTTKVFDRFYRGRHAPNVRGSGIGLSLVKHVVDAHGGRAWATNALGGGAEACIALPYPRTATRDPDDSPDEASSSRAPEASTRPV